VGKQKAKVISPLPAMVSHRQDCRNHNAIQPHVPVEIKGDGMDIDEQCSR
jgi:hypothetical protein